MSSRNKPSEGAHCKTCKWSVFRVPEGANVQPVPLPQAGTCRRHAPAAQGWPVIWLHDWCGDHEIEVT